ncbi:hypothetical protein ACXYV5_20830 [Escherichia coli]
MEIFEMFNKKIKAAICFSIAFLFLMVIGLPDNILSPGFRLLDIAVSVYWFYLAVRYTLDILDEKSKER